MQHKLHSASWMKLIALFAFIFSLAGCGSNVKQITPTTPAPSVTAFKASTASITAGDSVTLTWTATNATTVTIDNGVGTVTGTSVSVKPSKTTTYTLTAANSAGTAVTATVTVTVTAAPVITAFTASQSVLTPATTGPAGITLTWDVGAGATVSIDNGVGAQTGTSVVVSPSATTTYTLTAANSIGGTVTATVTVAVRNNLAVLNGTAFAGTDRTNFIESEGVCGYPYYLATDANGNVYATDRNFGAVCKITPAGKVTVLASNNDSFFNDEGVRAVSGRAQASQNKQAAGLPKRATATSRLLPSFKSSAAAGKTTPASSSAVVNAGFAYPTGIAVTSDGSTVYVADTDDRVIRKIAVASDGTTIVSTLVDQTAGLEDLTGLALDGLGNLYVAEYGAILKIAIAADGTATVSTLAGGNSAGYQDGPAATAEFGNPQGLAVSADGTTVYVADEYYGNEDTTTIRKIAPASDGTLSVSTLAGGSWGYQDGSGAEAQFGPLEEITLSADGTTLYAADSSNLVVRKIALAADGTATVSTIAGARTWGHLDGTGTAASFTHPQGIALGSSGNLYVSEDYNWEAIAGDTTLREVAIASNQVSTLVLNIFGNTGGNADGIGNKAAFNLPDGVVVDGSGNIYVADSANSTIRKIVIGSDGKGTVSTLAGTAAVYGNADGTGGAAQFDQPIGLAIDPTGSTLYVADSGNGTIRQVDVSTGAVTTIVQSSEGEIQYSYPSRLAVDSSTGILYLADADNIGVFTVDPATGNVGQLTLTDSTGGLFNSPNVTGLAVYTSADKTKNYLYASEECAVFKIDLTTSTVTTLAGSTTCGYQDAPGSAALFTGIWNLSVDSQGNVYAVDAENSVVRRITPDGNVTTVVGTYGSTLNTMGVLPSSVYLPLAAAVDPTDNLLVMTPNAVLTLVP